jgi:hypothetical protein
MAQTDAGCYTLNREELFRIRDLKLLTSDRDYIFFALQLDFPGKLNPKIDVEPFAIAGNWTKATSTKPWVSYGKRA